ncbi:unnamed protein product, partial [Laminaria digitata]
AEAAAAEAAGGLGLENLRPHLSELRSAAFQLELCLALHARGCLRLSSRARAQAAVGFRAGLLVEALGRRYDVTATLVGCSPASMEAEENRSPAGGGGGGGGGAQDPGGHAPRGARVDKTSPEGGGGGGGGHERRAWTDTPNAELLVALSRLPRPEFETLGLEPWESSLEG